MVRSSYIYLLCILFFAACKNNSNESAQTKGFDTEEILEAAKTHIGRSPITITAYKAQRSKGGLHDYYSEGRYWWPDTSNLDGPYIRRDGLSNPELFTEHRSAIKDFEEVICDLTAAAVLQQDQTYAESALRHLAAWFVDDETEMNPSLLYAQAIKGIVDGRGIGMIDVIGLINVANCVRLLERKQLIDASDLDGVKKWFGQFAGWATTHPFGLDEKNNNNNHSTWYGAQIAAYGLVSDQDYILEIAIEQYKRQLEIQMDDDGRFPDELNRTKPSHYTNYNLYGWTAFALLLEETDFKPWTYKSKNESIQKAIDFGYQFFISPASWPYSTELEKVFNPDHNEFLYLASLGLEQDHYLKAWIESNPTSGSTDSSLLIWKLLKK